MKAAVAAVALCCLVHAGIAGALFGWSLGWGIGALAVAGSAIAVGIAVRRRRGRCVVEPSRSKRNDAGLVR